MSIKAEDLAQLAARVGRDNLLTGEADRIVYSTDIGSPPAIVDLLLMGGRLADAVVRVHSTDDVETVVAFCRKHRIPITPRAAATNALGGAVPKRKGLVVDMTAMRKVKIDEAGMKVTAEAGAVIADVEKRLNDVGLALPCYPTSARAATLGGFVAMDGMGIHSTKNGNIGKHVVELHGVGPDGKRFVARDQEQIQFYAGLGGSTGIITEVTVKVVEATKDKPVLIATKDYETLQALVTEVAARFSPKHVFFRNADFFALRTEAIGEKKSPLGGKHAVLVCFAESDFTKHDKDLQLLEKRVGAERLDDKLAENEWEQRFYPIRAKRIGPSLVAGETFVPTAHLAAYLARVERRAGVKDLSVEGHLTNDGRVYFFITTPDDERRLGYPLGWSTAAWILSSAKKFGGTSYQSGVWLQWESKSVFGDVRYKKLKAYKKQADYLHLMNPGTVFPYPAPVPEFVWKMPIKGPIPAPSLGFQLGPFGNPQLQAAAWMMRWPYRRRRTLGVKAAHVAADMALGDGLAPHTDEIWGCDLTSAQAIPNPAGLSMTQTVRGKMVLAKAWVEGRIKDPASLKPALDVADPSPDEAAWFPEYNKVQPVLDALRRTVQSHGVELEVQAVEAPVEEAAETTTEAKPKKEGLDIEAIKKQAAATPEEKKAWVVAADCIVCNGCESACPTDAAIVTDIARVDRDLCIADGGCFDACPTDAIRPGIEEKEKSAGWPKGSRLAGQFGVAE